MGDEKKQEERNIDPGKFGSERIKEEIKKWKTKYLKDGFSDEDAQQLAEIVVERGLKRIKKYELGGNDGKGGRRKKYHDLTTSESPYRLQAEETIEKIDLEIARLSLEIEELTKKAEKIAKRKDLYHKANAGDIEAERGRVLTELGDKLKLKKISKVDYDKEVLKKEEYFENIYKTRRENQKEEGFVDSTGALGFECPECHQPLFESFDKNGHAVLRCKEGHGPFSPRELYKNYPTKGVLGEKIGLPIWKAREADKMAGAYKERKSRLKHLLGRGDISKRDYKIEKKKAHKEIYGDKEKHKEEMARIDNEIAALNPNAADYETKKQALEEQKKEIDHKYKPRGMKFVRGASAFARFSRTGEDYVKKVIFLVALIGIGAVIASIIGNWWFFFGFLSIGLHYLTPPPEAFEKEGGKLGWDHVNPFGGGGRHAFWSWMKSITKVSAIIFFAYGFKSMGDVFNVFFVITCLAGYFSLKVGYDPNKPGEFIESLLRFGILGCYFLPLVVFASIFNSYVLAAIAFAFFAIPPMPNTSGNQNIAEVLARGLSGQSAYYEMFDKILFIILMGFALVASGSLGAIPLVGDYLNVGWQLTGTLKATFIYFWVIALIGGFFSPAKERPLTGMMFLGGATVIYAIGPGSQDIGSALLGQWWPTVNQGVTAISDPISKMFGQFGKTFGDAFTMLTCPTCYATQLMNGSYANNPVGETGPIGVELTGFEVTQVFIQQPFMITTNIKNNGAYDAKDVKVSFTVGDKAPDSRTTLPGLGTTVSTPAFTSTGTNKMTISEIGMKGDTCQGVSTSSAFEASDSKTCIRYFDKENYGKDVKPEFMRQNVWQTVFSSSGINCSISRQYELRKKSIPINVTLTYKYQTDSSLGKGTDKLEFISQAEWDRLARLDQLTSKLKTLLPESTSGPVQLPIGTPGLKSPILETQDFHIGLSLRSQQTGGRIEAIESLVLYYPSEFTLDACNPGNESGWKMDTATPGKVVWTPADKTVKQGDTIFFCHFKPLYEKSSAGTVTRDILKGSPTKSYIITAHANYTYSNSQQKLVKVEFGSWCCKDEAGSCADGYTCSQEDAGGKGICLPKGQTVAPPPSACTQPDYDSMVNAIDYASSQTGVEKAMIKAIIMAESSFYHCKNGDYTTSRTGCTGLMQLSEAAVADVKDPASSPYQFSTVNRYIATDNVLAGAAYFKILETRYGYTDVRCRIAAYNAGLWVGKTDWNSCSQSLSSDVKAYVSNVMDYYYCYVNAGPLIQTWYGPITKSPCTKVQYPS